VAVNFYSTVAASATLKKVSSAEKIVCND